MEYGIWYWHSPFTVPGPEVQILRKSGIATIYVRAATFTTDGVRVKTMIPQKWKDNAGGMPVVLTFNFDAGLGIHFRTLANSTIATDVVQGIVHEREIALKHHIRVVGIQMDVDCPTRLLGKYADLLGQIRSDLKASKGLDQGDSFSATALQTWLGSGDYDRLAEACDFVAPQFYEGRTGKTIDTVQPISDASNLPRGMNRAESSGKDFFVGLGIYGHAILYDSQGKLAGMYHGMQPEDALRHPSLLVEAARPMTEDSQYVGENLLTMKAVRPDLNGKGLGFQIAYLTPSAEMLSRELQQVAESRTEHCRGAILYRYPEAADEYSLPLVTISQVLSGKKANLAIRPKISGKAVPWSLIGTGKTAKRPPYEYQVEADSIGTAATAPGPNALVLTVRFSGPGLDGCETGEFDDVEVGQLGSDGKFVPCAPAHADTVILKRFHVLPGARIRLGMIEAPADGPKPIEISWSAQSGSKIASGTERLKAF